MADPLKNWLAQLSAVGWHPFPDYDPAARQLKLPCGPVIWITGKYHGADRDAWLGMSDGFVRLHGNSGKDDCDVTEFCRRVTAPAVVETSEQGRLF